MACDICCGRANARVLCVGGAKHRVCTACIIRWHIGQPPPLGDRKPTCMFCRSDLSAHWCRRLAIIHRRTRGDSFLHGEIPEGVERYVQRCPGCYVMVSREGGCTRMRCSMCGMRFTWTSEDIPRSARPWDERTLLAVSMAVVLLVIVLCVCTPVL